MGVASAASGGLGIVGGVYNMIQSAKQKSDAEDALANYKRQELKNIAEGLQVSTLGSDLQREEQARMASSQVGAAREAGTRGMMGSFGRIEAGNQKVMQQTGADLDAQQKAIDQMRAEDESRIRSLQENREIQDISALSSQYNAGAQGVANGLSQAIQGGSMIGNAFAPKSAYETTPAQTPMDFTNPAYQSPTSMRTQQPPVSYNPMDYRTQNQFAYQNPYQVTKR
jgi:hypothetical protein